MPLFAVALLKLELFASYAKIYITKVTCQNYGNLAQIIQLTTTHSRMTQN